MIITTNELKIEHEFESLIALNGNSDWCNNAYAVHKITKSQLKSAPSSEEVALMLAGLFKVYETTVGKNELVYHANGEFDIKILNDLMIRGGLMGRGMPINWCTYNTLKEARKHKLFNSYKLTEISKTLGFKYQAHDALSDCRATLNLMRELKKYE